MVIFELDVESEETHALSSVNTTPLNRNRGVGGGFDTYLPGVNIPVI